MGVSFDPQTTNEKRGGFRQSKVNIIRLFDLRIPDGATLNAALTKLLWLLVNILAVCSFFAQQIAMYFYNIEHA